MRIPDERDAPPSEYSAGPIDEVAISRFAALTKSRLMIGRVNDFGSTSTPPYVTGESRRETSFHFHCTVLVTTNAVIECSLLRDSPWTEQVTAKALSNARFPTSPSAVTMKLINKSINKDGSVSRSAVQMYEPR